MAVIENDYAAYIQTPQGEVPIRDLDAQEKIDSLSEEIDYYFNKNKDNVLDLSKTYPSKSINNSGILETAKDFNVVSTDFLEVESGEKYEYKVGSEAKHLLVVAFYNNNKEFISRLTTVSEFTVPDEAKYIRVSSTPNGFFALSSISIKGTSFFSYPKNLEKVNIGSKNFDEDLTKEFLGVAKPYAELKGYYANGIFVENDAMTCKKFKANKYMKYYYTGKILGSAHYQAVSFFNNNTFIGGIFTSSSIEQFFDRQQFLLPENCTDVMFCAYTFDGYEFIVEEPFGKIKNIDNVKETKYIKSVPCVDNFMGHCNFSFLNTEYQHIICYGQSLSNGSDSLYVSDEAIDGNYFIGTNIANPSTDTLNPLKLTSNHQHPIVSAVNSFSELVRKYKNIDVKFVAGSYGAGGQSIAQLMSQERQDEIKTEMSYSYDISTEGRYQIFLNSLEKLKECVGEKSVSCPAIVFLQGERDYFSDEELSSQPGAVVQAYACGGDKNRYKLYMSRLKNDMQNAVMDAYSQTEKPIFYIYQVSGAFIHNSEMTINMAQIEFANEHEDVILLPSPYFVPNYNSGHLTTNGYRWYGEYIAKVMFETLFLHSRSMPMSVCGIKVEDRNIKLKICNAILPIEFDTYTVEESVNYGFTLLSNGEEIEIQEISVYGDEILIKTNTELEPLSNLKISYAGKEKNGSGNVRDNCKYISMYTYWDDSSDKGLTGNLIISHRPTDKEDKTIVGKHYPMYNWLSSFYKSIK